MDSPTSETKVANEDESAEPKHNLMVQETRTVGVVSWKIYQRYFQVCRNIHVWNVVARAVRVTR